ncbi:unnamed protein product [Rhizophagus irregularis]|nr:unnamed protein product [Rhizophagus irregularis]
MEKPSFDQMFRRTGKFQDSSGGLTCSEEQENSKDSIWWASEKRKTKKPRFVSLSGLLKNENPKIKIRFGFGWIVLVVISLGLGLWICFHFKLLLNRLCFLTNSRFFNVDGEI